MVNAFNSDLPYDRFVVLQLAADLLPEAERGENLAALGFHALRDRDDDRVDVTGRTFLGLTIGCAQCHDHKFDPIPQTDFYALQGVFSSTEDHRYPLAPADEVEAHDAANKRVKEQKLAIDLFLQKERDQLIDVLMQRTADFLVACYRVAYRGGNPQQVADEAGLDRETLDRWLAYLKARPHEHPYLDDWYALMDRGASPDEARQAASDFQQQLLSIHLEKRAVDDRNYVKLGGAEGARTQRTLLNTNLEFIEPVRYYLWRDMTAPPARKRGLPFVGGVYHYGQDQIERFLGRAVAPPSQGPEGRACAAQASGPATVPVPARLPGCEGSEGRPAGDPRRQKEPRPSRAAAFSLHPERRPSQAVPAGSGRLELARAIVSPENPLTARVFANRLWQWRFGRGIVTTPSNFRPTRRAPDASGTAGLAGVGACRLGGGRSRHSTRRSSCRTPTVAVLRFWRPTSRRIPTTGCCGVSILCDALMQRRCAMRYWPCPVASTLQWRTARRSGRRECATHPVRQGGSNESRPES